MSFRLLLCAIYFFVLSACREPDKNPVSLSTPQELHLPIITVNQGSPLEYTSVGSIVSEQRVTIASRLSGYLLDIPLQEGDTVKVGQLLARLDSAEVDGAIRQSTAAVSAAKSALHDANIDAARFNMLFAQGHIAENDVRKIKLHQSAATEQLNQAQAVLSTAKSQLQYTEIHSPISGIVVEKHLRAGDLAVTGMPILTLESGRLLRFETEIPERQLSAIYVGKSVRIQLDGLSRPLLGTVERIVRSGDSVTRSYPVKIALADTTNLRPGMFGRAVFEVGTSDDPLLPVSALIERGGLRGVFVLGTDNVARFRWLRIGREWPTQVAVTVGLSAHERVVDHPPANLHENDRVIALAVTRGVTP